jgi:hypothetical protein
VGEKQSPSSLPGFETLGGADIFQVLVVRPHYERMFRPSNQCFRSSNAIFTVRSS